MELNEAVQIYGNFIDIGPCILGDNLNLLCLRGFAPLDKLAIISAPDVLDAITNPEGTQRPLEPKRAALAYDYSAGSMVESPQEDPRAYPEVLLNVRDTVPVEFFDVDTGASVDVDSKKTAGSIQSGIVRVKVDLRKLDFPIPSKRTPKISRFDGNHRLSGMDQNIGELVSARLKGEKFDMPSIPFSMFVSLSRRQEEKLFLKINGTQKGVQPAMVEHQRRKDFLELKPEVQRQPGNAVSFISIYLGEPGGAFENMVFEGGSKAGLKGRKDIKIMLNNNTVTGLVDLMLGSASENKIDKLRKKPDYLFSLVNNYWIAVMRTFPDAWRDKKHYILFQTIGLQSFARYWGYILDDVIKAKSNSVEVFEAYLKALVGNGLSLDKANYRGVAGVAGATEVYENQFKARHDQEEAEITLAELRQNGSLPVDDQLENL